MELVAHREPDAREGRGVPSRRRGSRPRLSRTRQAFSREIERGRPAITEDPSLLCRAEGIDAIIEVTGTVEFAAACCGRGHRPPQTRRPDERRARRHAGLRPQGTRRRIRCRHNERRWRSARCHHEPVSLRPGDRCPARPLRQHQGPPRSSSNPVHAGGIRSEMGSEPHHGHVVRRRDEDLLRASDRGERDGHAGGTQGDARPQRRTGDPDPGGRPSRTPSRSSSTVPGSSITSLVQSRAPACSCLARPTIPRSVTT